MTHKLREDGQRIAKLVLGEGAYIYVCGDGNRMAKDVFDVIKEELAKVGFDGNLEAAGEYLKDMRTRQRYLQDIWS